MDKGPWTRLYNNADECVGVVSDDIEHDVSLRVSGDFESREQFKAYCDWLIEKLNAVQPEG